MKCTYLCFGFNDFSRKNNWKEVIGRESLSRVLASGNSSIIIIALLVNNGAKYGTSWFISQRYSMTLRFLKISLKKEVHWWCNHFFLMMSSTKWFLANKLYTSHVSQSVTSLIIFISRWVLMVQISTTCHVWNLRYYWGVIYVSKLKLLLLVL